MEEKILAYLTKYPGSRKREIAGYLNIWLCDATFRETMNDLEKRGVIYYKTHNDPANMEYYDEWYIRA